MSKPPPASAPAADPKQQRFTLADINRLNNTFWKQQTARDEAALQDPLVAREAFERLRSEWARGVPARCQLTLSAALNSATKVRDEVRKIANAAALTELARKGGVARKRDALQYLICERVKTRPNLTEKELLDYLECEQKQGIIQDIEGRLIYFTQKDGSTKIAKVSGLKDRLSRAKREANSR